MNRNLILAALVAIAPLGAGAQDATPLESDYQKFSYAMGFRMARDLMQQGVNKVDPEALRMGLEDAMSGESFRFTPDEIRAAMQGYQQEVVAERAALADSNNQAGKAFLSENGKKDGVVTLDKGVQYKVLTEGTGEKPGAGDKVKVHYVGTLLDGTEFDSSRKRGEPTELGLGDVIPGWQQALAEMPTGSRWMVWIPPEQAYGLRGAGALIGPNETLAFDIELIEVMPPASAPAPAAEMKKQ